MADVIDLQAAYEETPDEEKASAYSVAACHNSYRSFVLCWVK
ncbi:hypothetical protein [Nigerium massiliense]|nr:hypothetical protein [Nigerium massiliense]